MAVYRTAQGRMLDMGKIMTQNERVRAVGNGKMNARGDTIDAQGRVVVPVSQKISEAYAKTVVNTTAVELNKKPETDATSKVKASEIPITELTDFEQQLNQEMADELEIIEEIKKTEDTNKKGKR